MLKQILLIAVLGFSFWGQSFAHTATNPNEQSFIEQYRSIAIAEMKRSGIPASIILAQAILESSWGNSDLAKNSNNYFGIKCKSNWLGETYYHMDDDFDADGNKIKSCFRVYTSIYESFKDHTDFLLYREYYKNCFKHDSSAYFEWALALQKAGYATAKDYAYQLVSLIERHKLYEYDSSGNRFVVEQSVEAPVYHVPAQTEVHSTTNSLPPVVDTPVQKESIVSQNTVAKEQKIFLSTPAQRVVQPEPQVPPVFLLAENYEPKYREGQMQARSARAALSGQKIKDSYKTATSKEARIAPRKHPYNKNVSTYKRHIRPIKYYPKASNETRR